LALTDWIKTEQATKWIDEHPRVEEFVNSITNPGTQATYFEGFERFCEYTTETPEDLLTIRFTKNPDVLKAFRKKHDLPEPVTAEAEDGAKVIFALLKKFLTKGTVKDRRMWTKYGGRTIHIGKQSKTRRLLLDCAVRRYFRHFEGDLPHGDFKIEDYGRVPEHEEFNTEDITRGIQEARDIIASCRQPYRTLFTASFYAPLGRDELVKLNDIWETQIHPQLNGRERKDLVVIEYKRRKKNPQPFRLIVPARVFDEYRHVKKTPFKNRNGTDVQHDDLNFIWQSARRRSGIGKKEVRQHDLRDLWETIADRAGMKESIVQFIMGHRVSKYNYNKIYKDTLLVKREYRKFLDYVDAGAQPIRKQDLTAEILRETALASNVPEAELNKVDLAAPDARQKVRDLVLKKRQQEAATANKTVYEVVDSKSELVRKLNSGAGWQLAEKQPPNLDGFLILRETGTNEKK
jgi:hypothetical protein